MNVLLIKRGAIGDILMTTPLIRQLKKNNITIDYLTTNGAKEVLKNNTNIRKLITVNDQKTASNARLKCDQTLKIKQLTICVENKKQSIIKPNLEKLIAKVRNLIIYEDQNIVAINKPAGLAVQGGTKVLLSIDDVLAYIKPGEILKIVHRLDKDTSGVLLFARNAMVANALMNEFKDHKIKKE